MADPAEVRACTAESDEALAARAPRDREAFAELYRRYVDAVYRFMRYQAPVQEAQELTARVFFHAYRAAHQFRGDGATYRSWLFRIAHNTLASFRREHARSPVLLAELPDAPDTRGDPFGHAARAELRTAVREAVGELPSPDRELLVLRYVEGLEPREIAQALGRSDVAVRVQVHRLLRRLRRRLEQRGVEV